MFPSGDTVIKGVSKSWLSIIIIAMLLFSYIVIAVPSTVRAADGVPDAPTLQSAVAGNTQVTLTWLAPTNIGGSAINHYTVQGGPSTIDNIAGSPYTITGLTNGQSYTFTVTATNSNGTSLASNSLSAIPFSSPDAPTLLTAVAGNGQVTLTWSAPTNTGGYPIDHYSAYQSGTLKTDNIAGLTTTINGLAKGQSSTFTVRAVTSKATSVDSNSLSATPTGVPDAPTGLTAAPTNTQITLSWTAPANTGGLTIDHYTVSQGGTVKVDNIAGLTTIISGLTNGQSYTFTVTATNSAGTSAASTSVSSTPYTTPNAPTGLRAVAGNGQVTLNWTAPANNGGNAIDYYTIVQSSAVLTTHYTGSSATITGLTNGQSYAFSIAAHNNGGNGAETGEVIVTPFTVPSAPVLTGVPGVNNVSLSWNAPDNRGANITYYLVYEMVNGTWKSVGNLSATKLLISGLIKDQSYQFAVAAHNKAGMGNKSATLPAKPGIYITIALTASAAYIHYPAVNNATISLSATTSNKSITLKSANYTNHVNGVLFDNSLLYVYGSTFQATYPMVLGEGTNVISFTCNDTAGNTVTKWITIIYDNDNPKLLITSPADGSYNITGIMTLRWNGSDALSGIEYYNVSVFDGAIWTNYSRLASTENSKFLDLVQGNYTVYVLAVDKAGNQARAAVAFVVDKTAPTILTMSPTGSGNLVNATIRVRFSESMNPAFTTITVSNGIDGYLLVNGNNATFTPYIRLAYATNYTVSLTGKDLAGNPVSKTWWFKTMKDEGIVRGVVKDANGRVLANASVKLSNSRTTTTDSTGSFSFINVTIGSYNLTVSKNGYQNLTKGLTTKAGQSTDLGTLTMQTTVKTSTVPLGAQVLGVVAVGIIALLVVLFLLFKKGKGTE